MIPTDPALETRSTSPPEVVPSPGASNQSGPPATGAYARLARRLARRTTDVIVIALVGMGLYNVGDQLTAWWHAEPPEAERAAALAPTIPDWDFNAAAIQLRFGQQPLVISRETFQGSAELAYHKLTNTCLQLAASATYAPVTESSAVPVDERRLIQLLEAHPAQTTAESVRVYHIRVPQVTGIAVREIEYDGVVHKRVGCWASLLPGSDDAWTLVAFYPSRAESTLSGVAVDLPPGASHSVSIGQPERLTMLAFDGTGPLEAWRDHFDRQLSELGYQRLHERNHSDRGLAIRWSRPNDDEVKSTIDLMIHTDAQGRYRGMLTVTPQN